MNCMTFVRLIFSDSSSSGSMAVAFRLSELGTLGVETRSMLLMTRVRLGSGSKHKGFDVASLRTVNHSSMCRL